MDAAEQTQRERLVAQLVEAAGLPAEQPRGDSARLGVVGEVPQERGVERRPETGAGGRLPSEVLDHRSLVVEHHGGQVMRPRQPAGA